MSTALRRLSALIRLALHNFPNPQPDLTFRTAVAALQPDAPLLNPADEAQIAFADSVYATIRALPDTYEGDPR